MTAFRLWAPGTKDVALEMPEGNLAMTPLAEGWYQAETAAPFGTRYRFVVGGQPVPDPASRAQADGWSVVTDPDSYRWRSSVWRGRPWEEAVFYELHVGLMEGFAGVEKHLPMLADLGVTAVELMPVGHFPGQRNWGYDGILPYAPAAAYGTPDDLKRLIDRAHGLGLMMFLDVVYNHFGPDGNYLPLYAPPFFREDRQTPWGAAIDFRREAVRRFFIDNAVTWIREFHFDGLRLDAVHAIADEDFVVALAQAARAAAPDRHVHLVVENENNDAALLKAGGLAQWNDDFHHALHVLLTGEHTGYYADYAGEPAKGLAKSLGGGFICERKSPGARLPPAAFVNFLQNHDHVGNRALGERLTLLAPEPLLRAAIALLLLAPPIPLIFFGEETGARESFFYFCDHADAGLADAVREGRRNEFAKFPEYADPENRARIPDPNALETFERSRPSLEGGDAWRSLYKSLLLLRHTHIIPRLKGAQSESAAAVGPKAVQARWRMGDGARLTLFADFGPDPAPPAMPDGTVLWNDGRVLCWINSP